LNRQSGSPLRDIASDQIFCRVKGAEVIADHRSSLALLLEMSVMESDVTGTVY
jgi:hypothetical protein